jgi:putative tricarboxylic transport membrane protein
VSVPDAPNSGRDFWRCDRFSALLLVALAGGVAWQCRTLPLGSLGEPGPAAWPLLLAVLLGLLALAILAGAATSPPVRALRWGERWHALAIIGAAAFAASALETLGFRLTILAVLLFLIGVVERRRLLPTLLVSFGLSFGMHFVFSRWLKVPLPIGLFGL